MPLPRALDSPWLAMGVIIGRDTPPFRRQIAGQESVVWRYVTTRAEHASDARFVVVEGCPDFVFSTNRTSGDKLKFGFQFSCFCKAWAWFGRALSLFPGARFVGKMEDDSVLHDLRVVAELAAAHRAALRAQPGHSPLLWFGHFDWASHRNTADGFRGTHCGVGDNFLLKDSRATSMCPHRFLGVDAPYASGGLDIRSHALVAELDGCAEARAFVRGFEQHNASPGQPR